MGTISVTVSNNMGLDPGEFRDLCERIYESIVENTPVDTGYCQSRWDISFLSDDECEISNDCDYVSYLEDGHSKQAPHGMVQVALDRFL